MKKKLMTAILTGNLLATLLFTACGSAGKSVGSMEASAEMEAAAAMETSAVMEMAMQNESTDSYSIQDVGLVKSSFPLDAGDGEMASTEEGVQTISAEEEYTQKLIKDYYFSIESTDFATSEQLVEQTAKKYGGYVENLSSSGYEPYRYSYYVVRIPVAQLDGFLADTANVGTISSRNESRTDITNDYYDVAAHIEALETQHSRLLQLMEKAEAIEDIIALEERLSAVEYELGSYKSQMKIYDNKVDYATISIDLHEVNTVSALDNDSFSEKISKGLATSFANMREGFVSFLICVIVALPYIVLWGLVIVILILIIRKILRGKNKGEENEEGRRRNHKSLLGKKRDGDQQNTD